MNEKLNDLSVNMEHTTNMIALAEQMVTELYCGDVLDDKIKTEKHISRLLSLLNGTLEFQRKRESEVDELINAYEKGEALE